MIIKLLENVAWSLFFIVFFFTYTGAWTLAGVMLEERIGIFWATVIITLLNVIFLNIIFMYVFGGYKWVQISMS